MADQNASTQIFAAHHLDDHACNQALEDSAFDPQSGFIFDDGDDEEFHNMQQNIASLNVLAEQNDQQRFHSMSGQGTTSMSAPDQSMGSQFDGNFVNPFLFDQHDFAPDLPSWQMNSSGIDHISESMQATIASRRNDSVAHQYGQITPPDDDIQKGFPAPSRPPRWTPPSQASTTAKSERARKAANQRHAKAKKTRKDSARKTDSEDVQEDLASLDEDKREKYREKNRLAAAKCRAKKKMNTEDLEESARMVGATNSKLKAEARELRDLFSSLRDEALSHDPSQGCGCQAIHAYNMHKAQETAQGAAMGRMNMHTMPSPSSQSKDPASPASVSASSRTQSFSSVRPQSAKHSRTQSLAGIGGCHQSPVETTHNLSSSIGDIGQNEFAFAQLCKVQPPQSLSTTVGGNDRQTEFVRRSSEDRRVVLE